MHAAQEQLSKEVVDICCDDCCSNSQHVLQQTCRTDSILHVDRGRKPNLSKMKVFGLVCYAYKQEKKKLDSQCTKGIFVGYDNNSPSYLVYYADTERVLYNRLVKFVRKSVAECKTLDLEMSDDDLHGKRFVSAMPKAKMADQSSKETL